MNDLFTINLKSSYITCGILAPVTNSIVVSNPLQIINYSSDKTNGTHDYLTNDDVTALSLSFDSRFIAYSTEVIRIYDIESKKIKRTLSGHNFPVVSISSNHKSSYIWASASSEDGMVNVWDIRSHPACCFSKKISKIINCVSFSPDDSLLACGGDQLILLDTVNFHTVLVFPNNLPSLITSLYFNPFEYVMLTSSTDKVLRCYDIETMECISQSIPFQSPIRGIQFDLNGDYVFAATDKNLTLMTFEPYEIINVISLTDNINRENNMQQTLDFIINPLDTSEIMILNWDEKRNITVKNCSIVELFTPHPNELIIPVNGEEENCSNLLSPDEESLNSIPSLPSPPIIERDVMKESLSMNDLDIPQINKVQSLRRISPSPTQTRRTTPISMQRKPSPDIIIKTKSPSNIVKPRTPSVPKSSVNISSSTNKINKYITKDCRSKSISSLKRESLSTSSSNTSIQNKNSSKISVTTIIKKPINRSSSSNINKINDISTKAKVTTRPPIIPTEASSTTLFSKFQTIQTKCEAENKGMLRELETVVSLVKNGGLKKLLSQRMTFSKTNSMGIVFRELLNMESLWSLQTCELAIPHLTNLLSSQNKENIDIGLETLKFIVTEYVPIILENLNIPEEYNFRGDIVGAERKERSITCHQRLLQLFLNSSFLKERMTKEQQCYFQEIIDKCGLDIN
ncbi:WD40 repeat and WD40/YVTN repeat-like-containing domain and WD40-repeat-containing domain and Katanin p80 subunit, C-terminal domain-containing protein [Strongyloides ratti]|uniref:WD40 repeat and WD40/YVTN repeat-like-containing domain and WD40-repeat-containing domain and Katanin p80 subunit, C-terminal domain-containing protein n=1 Tax=Strongyloides ratti TaxID=34506 RepID=A0A090L639_STRRB|nr:WD40 repeat and WD40/YVTN repeat-like-containing domain and WD40-repeat-containing domain and Katanin p80 subunit, C-terminal domain-containing protein [Strongyloides ratti]CEF65241.1 WD40 repeat and WD40/YVTN repeat-like-containing domain and WD40-repeat-containing domain and Katanin p80 subunit, C-terminal domain-containing protein [Strongyloides ratti]